jgi:hypothetical protein
MVPRMSAKILFRLTSAGKLGVLAGWFGCRTDDRSSLHPEAIRARHGEPQLPVQRHRRLVPLDDLQPDRVRTE